MPAPDHFISTPAIPSSLHVLSMAGVGLVSLLAGCAGAQETALASDPVPEWATDAVFYQIFPERFRNGDPSNDPTRASLEYPVDERVPAGWQVSPWTEDWYARPPWEAERG
jgi:hypothetical protein